MIVNQLFVFITLIVCVFSIVNQTIFTARIAGKNFKSNCSVKEETLCLIEGLSCNILHNRNETCWYEKAKVRNASR